jgi:hypothetical protein
MNSFYFYKTLDCNPILIESNYEKILSPVEFLVETVEEKTLEKFLGGYELFCIHPKRTAKSLLEKRLQGKTLVRGEYKGLTTTILLEEGSSSVSVFIRVPYSIKSREDLEMILYCRSFAYPEEKYFSRIPIDMGPIREDLWIERTDFSQNLMDRYYDKGFSIKVEDRKEYFVVEG